VSTHDRGPIDPGLDAIAAAIDGAGGRAILVGGVVRDRMLGRPSKDYDVEVFGLRLERLESVLADFGEVIAVGRSFGVLRVKGIDCDFSMPRRDSKTGRGHRGFLVELDPSLDFATAARRRDLTINSIGLDLISGEILDPHGGRADLEAGLLRATDPAHFSEDPLRGLRVAQFAARFEMQVDSGLVALCRSLDLAELPGERLFEEFRKLLGQGVRPSLGLEFLRETGLLRFFPELQAMVGVPQDPLWHPEGNVWEHTLLVVDESAAARTGDAGEDLIVMFAALCHDLGKPVTTEIDEGRVRSPNHEREGIEPTRRFLARLRAPAELVRAVELLVDNHLAPAHFVACGAKPRAYRRLARKLAAGHVNARILHRLARADHFGRTTRDALAREFPDGDEFLRQAAALQVEERADPDVVLGRHLIERGMRPGPEFGRILAGCREIQDRTGSRDPQAILARYFGEGPDDNGEGGADSSSG
jgi:tRNA nucleotidyltransferase (CCA-adding enzyme)